MVPVALSPAEHSLQCGEGCLTLDHLLYLLHTLRRLDKQVQGTLRQVGTPSQAPEGTHSEQKLALQLHFQTANIRNFHNNVLLICMYT